MGHASLESSRRLTLQQSALLALGGLLGMLAFLVASLMARREGFPLDDSWIHATYARNLAISGRWFFRPGMASAGSTSPLWTVLLVPGYWLGLAPLWWSHILGFFGILSLSILAEFGARKLSNEYQSTVPWAGLLVGTEWHLLWAAVSGMETLLYATLLMVLFLMLLSSSRRYSAMGILTGLCVWIRPDALTILPFALLLIGLRHEHTEDRPRALAAYLLGMGALLLPYLVLNLMLSGTPFPNSFYAKQAEYAGWQARSPLYRIGATVLQLSSGSTVLLWPALGIHVVRAVRARSAASLAILTWCLLYVLMYTLRLPPYQHGRYLMPAMPLLLLFGFLGLWRFKDVNWRPIRHSHIDWAWKAALILMQCGFVILGARAYAQDVGLIQTEMVTTAKWVESHLPTQAVIAAHDIGALGYYDDHALLDLAGLLSPEVVPFLRDEDRLAAYLDFRGATHLVAFPDVYPRLVEDSRLIFSSGGDIATALGEANMGVYCWRCP